ncbi:hypothetical protein RhiirA4_424091 [Rhizophagus irregularis]|uniref:Uncharacterized protein n=1 Tax=Rhizophagus irregularis TaxID=588596 RepID=A0A2I1GW71_9GLOM|nr:hypothetical protein RhiirA4_424091 [Rhizophagus irregularis]
MKYIVVIIVLFLIFHKTFAWKYTEDCTEFTQKNQVTVTVHGPSKFENPEHAPCCLQQGPMIIGDYKFYNPASTNPTDLISTVWDGRQWVNGYSEDKSANIYDCLSRSFNCNTLYEGEVDYTHSDNFDSSKFPSLTGLVLLQMTVYAYCHYERHTTCERGCTLTSLVAYNPPS